ncbi:polyketide cyclase/dehydrase and lipid transportsuperfamily protein [Striga asiatica]|uniref:Polyketide cyclase/dehydrase and lipid transportsuperfamily protein n=1 Tax=Striga asiatica TaxID=4170 RepID=A0A5A7QFA9_STRAF|nr:polyketide cyclase/dehydrase and lipid transportsuperfamily protein [Striga asiatica]
MVRDFFWDDEFRLKWDDMLIHAETLKECSTTGTMIPLPMIPRCDSIHADEVAVIYGARVSRQLRNRVDDFPPVHWARYKPSVSYLVEKLYWFYIRHEINFSMHVLYLDANSITGVPNSSVPRRNKPRRVDLYYSSWFIRTAESKRDGRPTACQVILFHHEDMGIPREIAKLGIRQGMWGAVKKIDLGLRTYHKHRTYHKIDLGLRIYSPSLSLISTIKKFNIFIIINL